MAMLNNQRVCVSSSKTDLSAKRREFSGMIYWLTMNNHPSNPSSNPTSNTPVRLKWAEHIHPSEVPVDPLDPRYVWLPWSPAKNRQFGTTSWDPVVWTKSPSPTIISPKIVNSLLLSRFNHHVSGLNHVKSCYKLNLSGLNQVIRPIGSMVLVYMLT